MNHHVMGIGNALVDIEIRVAEDFINELALTKGGMTLTTPEEQTKILDKVSGHAQKIVSGGSAANTIHGISALGGKTYYLGRVADDAYGTHYTEDMKSCSVGFPGPDAKTDGTGTCLILVTPDSERTMLTHLGISAQLHASNVDETLVRGARMVYIEGYLWTGDATREAAMKMAEVARLADIPVAFTLSDGFVVNTWKDSLIDFLRLKVDILFCNEVEAMAMGGGGTLEKSVENLKGMVPTLFVTRGKQGSLATANGDASLTIRPFPVEAVDTTGAGDLYAAGVLYGLTHHHSLEESAILGSYCSAQVVTHMGGRMPLGSHTQPSAILKAYRKL